LYPSRARTRCNGDKGKGECPRIVEDAECEPYERLYKIDLRKKPAQLFREFKAALAAVDARRGLDPAEHTAWKQDRTRKRAEEWDHLEVWRLRRQVPNPLSLKSQRDSGSHRQRRKRASTGRMN